MQGAGQGPRHRGRRIRVAAHVDRGQHRRTEVAARRRERAEGQADRLGRQVRPRIAADDNRGAHRAFPGEPVGVRALCGRHRAPQRARCPGVHGNDGQRGGDHRRDPRTHHRSGHPGRHRLAAVDALPVMADPPVHRDQPRRLVRPARREDTERRRPHRQAVAPGMPVLGGDRGGEAPAQILQRAPLTEPGAAERPLVQVGDPQMPGPLHMGDGQRRTVPGEQQPGEDRVLRVVRTRGVVAHEALDPAPATTDLGRPQILRRCAQRVTDRETEQGAPGPVAQVFRDTSPRSVPPRTAASVPPVRGSAGFPAINSIASTLRSHRASSRTCSICATRSPDRGR